MLQPTDFKPTASGKATKMDRLIRWVIIPLVLVIGLSGLVYYVAVGHGSGPGPVEVPTDEAAIAR
ncbi:MAG: hypothetical protein WAU70_07230 [Flavobacteriales bacterium]